MEDKEKILIDGDLLRENSLIAIQKSIKLIQVDKQKGGKKI